MILCCKISEKGGVTAGEKGQGKGKACELDLKLEQWGGCLSNDIHDWRKSYLHRIFTDIWRLVWLRTSCKRGPSICLKRSPLSSTASVTGAKSLIIHSVNRSLLSALYVSGTVVSSRDRGVTKYVLLMEFISYWGNSRSASYICFMKDKTLEHIPHLFLHFPPFYFSSLPGPSNVFF